MDWQAGHEMTMEWGRAFFKTMATGEALPSPVNDTDSSNLPFPMVVFLELSLVQFLINGGVRLMLQPFIRMYMNYISGYQQPGSQQQSSPKMARLGRKINAHCVKFSQATMETLFYSIYFAMGLRIMLGQSWIWPSTQWWEPAGNRDIAVDLSFFYIAYGARYFQNFVMVFLEPKRKDFLEMQIHHSVTCLLIYLSYCYGFCRVGLAVMVLLDVGDPPLHIAKQIVYLKEVSTPKSAGLRFFALTGDIFFAIFAVDFTATRMMMYPYIVWSATVELYNARADLT